MVSDMHKLKVRVYKEIHRLQNEYVNGTLAHNTTCWKVIDKWYHEVTSLYMQYQNIAQHVFVQITGRYMLELLVLCKLFEVNLRLCVKDSNSTLKFHDFTHIPSGKYVTLALFQDSDEWHVFNVVGNINHYHNIHFVLSEATSHAGVPSLVGTSYILRPGGHHASGSCINLLDVQWDVCGRWYIAGPGKRVNTSSLARGGSSSGNKIVGLGIQRESNTFKTCHLGWRTLLKCNTTNHACLLLKIQVSHCASKPNSRHT
jgi:hypothetical protein